MELLKNSWKKTKVGQVCELVSGGTPSREVTEYFGGGILWLTPTEISKNRIEFISNSKETISELGLKKSSAKIVPEGTVLLTSRATIGLIAIAAKPLTTNQGFANFICKDNIILNNFLAYWLESKVETIKSLSVGTTFKEISKSVIREIELSLPPIGEQQKIADLFKSIDDSIGQAEEQEKNLRALAKRLIDGLISDEPTFGNLLEGKGLVKAKYADVAVKMTRRIDLSNTDVERIVAGENMESEDFKIRSWSIVGKDYVGSAFCMNFKKGDILYGSRRTYLKKVSLADFDGVCANTTYVIRANEEILLQGLLKHIMLSESFTQYSISVSKGSTNPYINWKDLDNFTFQIPDIETQEKIVSILDEIIEIAEQTRQQKETLKNLKFKLLNEILG